LDKHQKFAGIFGQQENYYKLKGWKRIEKLGKLKKDSSRRYNLCRGPYDYQVGWLGIIEAELNREK
jgi:hypothetical protein